LNIIHFLFWDCYYKILILNYFNFIRFKKDKIKQNNNKIKNN
jgi:hypothetical protein